MTPRFLAFMPFILKWETEYNSDGSVKVERDPDDPGGTTKYGIDQRSHPTVDIPNLTEAGARRIYFDDYWTKIHADSLPEPVGEVCMNIGVNAGKGRAAKWLQQALGVTADGVIGPKTIDAANAVALPTALAKDLCDRLMQHYRDIAKGPLAKYLGGWTNRTNDLRRVLGIPR